MRGLEALHIVKSLLGRDQLRAPLGFHLLNECRALGDGSRDELTAELALELELRLERLELLVAGGKVPTAAGEKKRDGTGRRERVREAAAVRSGHLGWVEVRAKGAEIIHMLCATAAVNKLTSQRPGVRGGRGLRA